MKLKDTLQLGKTGFPMRANLPNKEVERQAEWESEKIYERVQEKNALNPSFVLHDGPPFANGNIHIGHALNKISKDIIVRYKSMTGHRAPYVPGWDTHGLPIEQALAKKGVKRKEMSVADYRQLCEDYAWEQINTQREDFKRLGIAGEWDNPYVTLTKEYEEAQIRVFGKMAENGYIYRGQKPIYWSPSSESALAEAEIEYQDVRSPNIYVAFEVLDGKNVLDSDTSLVIWTTTPWTLPANLGIAVHPDSLYSIVKADGKKYVVASELLSAVSEKIEWQEVEMIKEIQGKELEYIQTKHPFYDRTSLVILGEHVTMEDGTGLVHTAPGHGEDDYFVGLKYNLEALSPVDSKGVFTAEAEGLEGVFYDDANKIVTEWLEEKNALLKMDFFTHSYPHDWRTKKPVIFRATPQWFASIDKFREAILENIKEVEWVQPWGEQRITNMVKDRGDWVISRQRTWGVPLPIFYGETGEPIITTETINHVAELIGQNGSNIWFEKEAKDLLPEGFTHPSSPNGLFEKETDIMDVWFDSGSSHEAVLKERENLTFPADLYLEGSDQYRGWFNSSLTTSVAINGVAPYKTVLSQGMVLDGKGYKMSKSLGNTIEPNKIIKQKGADIVRLWTASVDAQSDVRVSMEIIDQVSEIYRKIRNTIRFLLANTTDFVPETHAIPYEELRSVDQYMMNRLHQMTSKVMAGYEKYDFTIAYKGINNFCTVDLSQFYLDFAKDVVYIETEDNYERRAMQTVFYETAVMLTKLLTPILPHSAEEIWSYLKEEEAYVQLADMPTTKEFMNTAELMEKWTEFMKVRSKILKALEVARDEKIIGKSFEAKVILYPNDATRSLLNSLDTGLRQILIVSDLEIKSEDMATVEQATDVEGLSIKVERAAGDTCERCRIISTEVGTNADAPNLCNRCYEIVATHFPEALGVQEEE